MPVVIHDFEVVSDPAPATAPQAGAQPTSDAPDPAQLAAVLLHLAERAQRLRDD
jgi:hypothetical protein